MEEDNLQDAIYRVGENFVKVERELFSQFSAAGILKNGRTKKDRSQFLAFSKGETPLEAVQKLEKRINEHKKNNPKLYET